MMFVKVVLAFFLFYIVIPSRFIKFDKDADGVMDKLFISLINMVFITILIIHALVAVRLYETLSLLFVLIAIVILASRLKKNDADDSEQRSESIKYLAGFMELFDSERGFAAEFVDHLIELIRKTTGTIRKNILSLISNPVYAVILLVVIVAAAWLRFEHSLFHPAFSHIDSYIHLIWSKKLAFNDMYFGGVYPRGLHSIYSALSQLFFIDLYWVTRFLGPLNGTLMVVSIFYFTLKITGNRSAAIITAVIFGFVNSIQFPSIMFRQTATLTQEFACIFILPGLYYLSLFLKNQKIKYALLFFKSLTIVLFVHPYAALFQTMWAGLMLLVWVTIYGLRLNTVGKIAGLSVLSALISFVPLWIGIASGLKFHQSSIEMVKIDVNYFKLALKMVYSIKDLIVNYTSPYMAVILPIMALIAAGNFIDKKKGGRLIAITMGLSVLIMFMIYRLPSLAGDTKLPELMDKDRTGVFFALVLTPFYGLGFCNLEKLVLKIYGTYKDKAVRLGFRIMALALCLLIIKSSLPVNLYKGVEEYDASAGQFLRIKNDFPKQDFTIVAPHEQYAQVLGIGYHYQLYDFIYDFSTQAVSKPDFKFPIPTHHIFFYIEKRPLHFGRPIFPSDAKRKLEPPGDDPFMQYYKTPDNRAIVEAKASAIIEAYGRTHDDLEVYYEDDDLIIYHLYQKNIDEIIQNTGLSGKQ